MTFYQSIESIFVAAPPARAYQALTDWKARAAWRPGLSIVWDGPDQAAVGQVVHFRVAGFPPSFFSYRVTGLEPGRRIFMEYQAPPLRGRAA
ncbi:MAG TPA: SRPBCC family protein, partial [bacterium]|nr:SRPBCC family protein [bacterium]